MEKIALVGNTGFVGSNLCISKKFDFVANSKNVGDLYNVHPDVLVYAGVTGTKWYANCHSEEDYAIIEGAKKNIELINPKKLVLISTVDVYNHLEQVNEDTILDTRDMHNYGIHRLELENWALDNWSDIKIIRLPAIYGLNLKKNFVYDMIHYVPTIVDKEFMSLLMENMEGIFEKYFLNLDGRYQLKSVSLKEYQELRKKFKENRYNALYFTNSMSSYQFYNLKNLWSDIKLAEEIDTKIVNLVSEPVTAEEAYYYIYQDKFVNYKPKQIRYNIQSNYAEYFGVKNLYMYSKTQVLEDLKKFVDNMTLIYR